MKLRQDLAALLPRMKAEDIPRFAAFYSRYEPHLAEIGASLYDRLDSADRERFLLWFLKRWAKIDLVNPVERRLYDATIDALSRQERPAEELDGRTYWLRDMGPQGHDFAMLGYDWWLGAHDIRYDQYQHGGVRLNPGDVIIDAGAFIGDTAVFFHHLLGGDCTIHSFELLDENLALLVHNLQRNGVDDDHIVLNRMALADVSGQQIVVGDGSTQGSTHMFGKRSDGVKVETVTLDDYVTHLGVQKVDFIKMDIEGAEVPALLGARHTIRHFRPSLAICLYHLWNDVFMVPRTLLAMGVPYRFGFKWVQLRDGWEAILLAEPVADEDAARPAGASTSAPASDAAERRADQALAAALAVIARRGAAVASPAAAQAAP